MKIGFVFSIKEEFMGALGKLPCKEVECKPFEVYEMINSGKNQVFCAISGYGKVKASSATTWLITKLGVDKVVGISVCGATNNVKTDDLIRITEVVNKDFDMSVVFGTKQKSPSIVLKKTSHPAVLFTTDHFTITANQPGYYDMAGYAVAEVAQDFGVECEIVKAVTDVIDSGVQNNQYNENFNSACVRLGDELSKYVK